VVSNARILVDSNVLLDVLQNDPVHFEASARALAGAIDEGAAINPVIYAEISVGFERIEDLEEAVPASSLPRHALPLEAAFLAGKCFLMYRRDRGTKRSPLPDFFIGAHAAVSGMRLLTRDEGRYRTYFPGLTIERPG
jgi:predicted nucleic acid-binding protein